MKKFKKILATSALLVGATIGATACGEIYISFDTGNAGTLADIEYNKDSFQEDVEKTVSMLSKPGYKVAGVYLDEDFTKPLTDIGSKVKEDFTIYVKWELADIAIKYDANTGSGSIADQYITYTQTGLISTNLTSITKTGYSLVGWNTKADGTGTTYSPGQEFTMNSVTPVTLYAMWSANSYSVVYDRNAESAIGNAIASSHVYNENFEITNKEYTRKGYTFTGWNTKADGTGTTYEAGDTVRLSTTGLTLYAMWSANSYTVSFAKGGEDIVGDQIASMTVSYDSKIIIPEEEYSRSGYSFAGWRIEASGDTLTHGMQVDMTFDSNITLYPVWTISNLPDGYNPASIEDMFVDYVESGNTYEYAMIKGKTYTLPDVVTIVSVTDTNVATISGNQLTINSTGTFTLRLARTSDINDIWDFKVIAKDNAYTISYFESDGVSDVNNVKWPNHLDTSRLEYTFGSAKNIPSLIQKGYTFNGWKLIEPAFIGGEWLPANTLLSSDSNTKLVTIPDNTLGNLKLKADFTINHNEIKFYNGTQLIATLDGDYGTVWTECVGYTGTQTLIDNMINNAPEGKMFAGWYTSNTDFSDNNKFAGVVYDTNKDVYARFVDMPATPTDLSCSSESLITWSDALYYEGVDVKYELYINSELISNVDLNSIDASLKMTNKGDYNIKVRTVYSISNTNISFSNTQYSDYATLLLTKTSGNSGSGMIEVVDSLGETVKRVMFNGMTYQFDYESAYANMAFTIGNQSVDGLAALTTTTNSDGSVSCKLVIDDEKTGTFELYQNGTTRLMEVVENISQINVGDSYKNYVNVINSYNSDDTTDDMFMDKESVTVSNDYLVGTENAFIFDINLYNTKLIQNSTTYNFASEEYLKYVFEVEDSEGNWISADTAYYNPSTNTIVSEVVSGGISCKPVRNGAEIQFPTELGQYGVRYKATIYLIYSRSGNNPTSFDINNLDLSQFKDKAEYYITLNSGYNVYTNSQLKTAYADFTKHIINVHRDIVAELDEHQMQADGSPINTQSSHIYDSNADPETYNNATTDGEYKTDGNIYKRASRSVKEDKIVINGNFCSIDATGVKLVSFEYNQNETADCDLGVNHQCGYQVGTGSKFLRAQTGIFRYQCPYSEDGVTNKNVCIFNNLNIIGNKSTAVLSETATTEEITAKEQADSASLVGIYCENSNVIVNNTNIMHTNIGIRQDSAYVTNWGWFGSAECNYVNIEDTYSEAIYGWNGKKTTFLNSKVTNCGAIAIRLDDTHGTNPTVIIDKHSDIENYMTGEESWFTNWGKSELATGMKGLLQPTLNSFGASALKSIDGKNQYINLIFTYLPSEMEEGEVYVCSSNMGGTKVICDKDDSRVIGYVYDENGNVIAGYFMQDSVTTTRTLQDVQADDRSMKGMYAFTQSFANTVDQFKAIQGAFSYISSDLSSNGENSATIKYTSNAIAYDAVKRLCEANNVARISEEVFNGLANYAIANNLTNLDPNNAISYLATEGIIAPEEEGSEKVQKQLLVLWNNLNTKIGQLNLGYSDTILNMFSDYSIMELKVNGYCQDAKNNNLELYDYSTYKYSMFTAEFIAKFGDLDMETTTLAAKIGTVIQGSSAYTEEALVGATGLTLEQVKYIKACMNDGYLGVRDELVISLVEELKYIQTAEYGGTSLMNYVASLAGEDTDKQTALIGQFVLYRIGVSVNNNEDRLLEVIMPMANEGNYAPLLVFVTTGTLTDDLDPTTNTDDWLYS